MDFAGEHAEVDAAAETTASALSLDTSRITNPRTRDAIDQVVARLDHSFDSMLAKPVAAVVFVALTEFVGPTRRWSLRCASTPRGAVAGLRWLDGGSPRHQGNIGRRRTVGVVLRTNAFTGYAAWAGRWRGEQAGRFSPVVDAAG
jgi:hypothetical protein